LDEPHLSFGGIRPAVILGLLVILREQLNMSYELFIQPILTPRPDPIMVSPGTFQKHLHRQVLLYLDYIRFESWSFPLRAKQGIWMGTGFNINPIPWHVKSIF
jgi:hypothetical protein